MQVPPSTPGDFIADRAKARAVAQDALAAGREMLSEPEAKTMLAAYGIPVVETRIANTINEAVQLAQEIGFPVAVKILSPEITHKSDVGGVALDLETQEAVRAAAEAMHKRLGQLRPDATLQGFSVQAMARRPEAHELIVGVTTDPVFGPVILFGQGGIAVEVTADHAVGLPPLNAVLARDLVSQTRVSKLLAGYRNRAPADMDAICRTLIQVSHLVTDIPEIVELDINPLLADSRGVIALDARVRVASTDTRANGLDRLAIRPYPEELEQRIEWQGQPLLLRPVKPEDGQAHVAFFNALDPEDVRYRMFIRIRELQPSQLARFTQIDYDREMAFVAVREEAGREIEIGVARYVTNPDAQTCEFALVVADAWQCKGLGRRMLERLIEVARWRGLRTMEGHILAGNQAMLALCGKLGFRISDHPQDATLKRATLVLDAGRGIV
jgi:acetyltransferase